VQEIKYYRIGGFIFLVSLVRNENYLFSFYLSLICDVSAVTGGRACFVTAFTLLTKAGVLRSRLLWSPNVVFSVVALALTTVLLVALPEALTAQA
jgi:hypothetical protein